MKINQKDWSCPKKQNARNETIILPYREHFSQSLPKDKQYWTMCGQCATPDGNPLSGSEFSQLVKAELILPEQFVGVELEANIHKLNVKAYPDLNFINNDFYSAMVNAESRGEFNPGIVNADLPRTPDGGYGLISKIMAFLTDTTDELLFIANFILRMRYYSTKDGDYVLNKLNGCPQFKYAMSEGNWELVKNGYYEYNGAGNTGNRTYMGSLVFVKK